MDASEPPVPHPTPHISVLGSLNMDLVSYVDHYPAPGETMTANHFALSPGGKGANQAIACAKLSRSRNDVHGEGTTALVQMAGAVGNDGYGTVLRENLEHHGVSANMVETVPGYMTGVAVIVVDEPTGENRIIVSPGANHARTDDNLGYGLIDAALIGADLLVLQLEVPLALVLQALKTARARGVPVLLNPAPVPATQEERKRLVSTWSGASILKEPLAHLVLNETETAAMVPDTKVEDLDTTNGLAKAADYLLGTGVEHVVMTLGGRGVYYATAAGGRGAGGELVPAEPVEKVVDTTAAGDTFVGQYALDVAVAKALGVPFNCRAAVQRAQRAAALTVQRRGAQGSVPWRDELGW